MRNIAFICFLHVLFCAGIFAQAENSPFAVLDHYVESEQGSWDDLRVDLSKLFQQERTKLNSRFEAELWKYLGSDQRKHYWVALFLDSDAYLDEHPPMPELALRIRLNGLKLEPAKLSDATMQLNPGKPDVRAIVRRLSMLLTTVVSAEDLGNHDLAQSTQKELESLLSLNQDLKAYLPTLSKYRRCLYERVNSRQIVCRKDSNIETNEGTISKLVVINGKPLSIPKLKFPKSVDIQNYRNSTIRVELVVDEQGNVVSAKAVEGPTELYDVAEKAALKARFTPSLFYGRPWTVTSQLSFNLQ